MPYTHIIAINSTCTFSLAETELADPHAFLRQRLSLTRDNSIEFFNSSVRKNSERLQLLKQEQEKQFD